MQEDPMRPQENDPVPEKVYRLAEYLWSHPTDLIDATQLLHRFDVTVEEFVYALALLEG